MRAAWRRKCRAIQDGLLSWMNDVGASYEGRCVCKLLVLSLSLLCNFIYKKGSTLNDENIYEDTVTKGFKKRGVSQRSTDEYKDSICAVWSCGPRSFFQGIVVEKKRDQLHVEIWTSLTHSSHST